MEVRHLARLTCIARSHSRSHPSLHLNIRSTCRYLSTSPPKSAKISSTGEPAQRARTAIPPRSDLADLSKVLQGSKEKPEDPLSKYIPTSLTAVTNEFYRLKAPPHHLHVYSTRHNTHLTLTRPDRNPIISISTGNLGFRKAGRGTYDAAYQLGAYLMSRIQQQGILAQISRLELVMRGFGEGRIAIQKILLGIEGMNLRSKVVKVTDSTRLKFGGTRSKKPRRLG